MHLLQLKHSNYTVYSLCHNSVEYLQQWGDQAFWYRQRKHTWIKHCIRSQTRNYKNCKNKCDGLVHLVYYWFSIYYTVLSSHKSAGRRSRTAAIVLYQLLLNLTHSANDYFIHIFTDYTVKKRVDWLPLLCLVVLRCYISSAQAWSVHSDCKRCLDDCLAVFGHIANNLNTFSAVRST